MKKLFLFIAAVLTSFSMLANTIATVDFVSTTKDDSGTELATLAGNGTRLVGSGVAKLIASADGAALNASSNKYGYRCDGSRIFIVFKFEGTTDLTIKHNANSTGNRYMRLYSFSSDKALSAITSSDWSTKTQKPFSSTSTSTTWGGGQSSVVTEAQDKLSWSYSTKGCLTVTWEDLPAGYYMMDGTGSEAYIYSFTADIAPACTPIGVASTGIATSVTYNSASVPFTMDKTTGVSSLTIKVYNNSDDSEVASYTNITPATSGSQAVTGLNETTEYYYKITTVSAGGDYCDGVTTAKSTTFTTLAAPVANPTITGAVNEAGWGSVSDAITVTSGQTLSIEGAVITCGGKTLTATASDATAEYTYAFDSWSGVTNGQSITANITATANFTRTANSYAVNYTAPTNGTYTIKVGDADAVSTNTTAAYGQTVTLAATPSSGYKLNSWTVSKAGGTVPVTDNQFTMPAEAVTVSATFEAILYTVTYNVNGGGSVTPSSAEQASAGASVTLPTPTWSGYTFDGWYNAGTKIGDANASYTPTSDITLYAKWTDNTDGKVFSYVDGNYGDKFQAFDGSGFVSSDQTGKDKTFTHATTGVQFIVDDGAWDKKNNAISALAKFKGGTSKMSVVIPTGKIATVKIMYGAYGTGDNSKLTVNSAVQAAPATKFDDGHTNAQIFSDMTEVTLESQTGTLTLGIGSTSKNNYIGRVSAAITGYVVTYAKGTAVGATGDSFTETKTAGSNFTLSDADDVFTREGYIHAGWSTSADGSTKTYDFGGSYTTDAAITLYPYWAAISSITYNNASNGTYTIQVGDEEAVSESTTAVEGQTITLAVTSTDEGYRFNGWTVSKAVGTVPVNNNQFTMPAEAVTVSAAFVKVYTISFANGGGSGDAPEAIEPKAEGETFTVPANTFTAPDDKTFDKWNDGTNDYAPGATYTVGTANVTLTALWKDNGGGTALDNTADEAKAVKRIENGMLIIEKNGHVYNAMGQMIK